MYLIHKNNNSICELYLEKKHIKTFITESWVKTMFKRKYEKEPSKTYKKKKFVAKPSLLKRLNLI